MNPRLRTVALCHEAAVRQFAPWSQLNEDLAVIAWRSVQRLTPEIAAQEPQAIIEMIEHLTKLMEGNDAA